MSTAALPRVGPGAAERLLLHLEWTVLRRLDGARQGTSPTLQRGPGMDFADLREYQAHDDVRHIDWNVTARLQQAYVREFHEDRDMAVYFLLDLSGSTDWGSALHQDDSLRTKRGAALELFGVLARLFVRSGQRVGAIIYRQRVDQVLPPGGGRGQVLRLLEAVARSPAAVQPPAAQSAPRRRWWQRHARGGATSIAPAAEGGESTRLGDLLMQAERILRRRSTVVLVSDFLSQPGWETPLGRLALRHDVIAVRLSDALERRLPMAGLVVFEDAESGETLLVDTDDPALRERYADLAEARAAAVEQALAAAGVDGFELGTDEAVLDAVRRFLGLRRLRARLGGVQPGATTAVAAPAVRS